MIDGKKPEIYFKVPDDKDLNEALDQIKSCGDLLNSPGPGDKFTKLEGDELKDVKKYFDDKEKGVMKPSENISLPEVEQKEEIPEEEIQKSKPEEEEIDEDCVTTKVLGDGVERIDIGNDNLECIKVSGDQLDAFSNVYTVSHNGS